MIEIIVRGDSAAKGNMKFKGISRNGKAIITEGTKNHRPWSQAVQWAAIENGGKVLGPVSISMYFTRPKPKSAPKRRVTYPITKPDIDKLERSVLDSLVAVGTIDDDANVVELYAMKVYPGEHRMALDSPGVVIRIKEF